jgi:hypothetical protein
MYRLDQEQAKKFAKNLLKFTAPILVIFFAQLSNGIDLKVAGLVALYALYGAVADYLSKIEPLKQ